MRLSLCGASEDRMWRAEDRVHTERGLNSKLLQVRRSREGSRVVASSG